MEHPLLEFVRHMAIFGIVVFFFWLWGYWVDKLRDLF